MQFHFISGLPRSGSSLLASILCQNPQFTSSIISPTGYMLTELHKSMSPLNEAAVMLNDDQRHSVLRGLFQSVYSDETADFVFDNNRRWMARLPLLTSLFPDCKMIVCVRDVREIVESFERLIRANPEHLSAMYKYEANLNVYQRVQMMFAPDGVIGFAFNGLRDAFFGPHAHHMLIIDYKELTTEPEGVLKYIHQHVGAPPFSYDFNNITPLPGTDDFDAQIGTPGLHSLGHKVEYKEKPPILPPDIAASLPTPFWR